MSKHRPQGIVRRWTAALGLGAAALLGGCATVENPDPLEPVNRGVFAFNEAVDRVVIEPAARGYVAVTPEIARTGVDNVFSNLRDLWSALNAGLQGKGEVAATQFMRFATNSTIGLGGLLDWATPLGMTRQSEDLGQTLGHWGVGQGVYLVLPLLGSSTTRDVVDVPFSAVFSPAAFAEEPGVAFLITGLRIIDLRAQLLGTTSLLQDVALDKYSFVRNAYLQRRESLVRDGEPPARSGSEERFDLP